MSRLQTPISVVAVEPAAAPQRQSEDAAYDPARLAPGSRVRVEVLAVLADGGARARLLDGGGELRLPFQAAPGTILDVVVSRDPQGAIVVSLPETPQEDASFSTTARLLAALAQAGTAQGGGAVAAARPLLAGAPLDTAALAEALARALEFSGLFYEAHQAQWVAGERTQEALLKEPQARLQPAASDTLSRQDAGGAATAGVGSRASSSMHGPAGLDGFVHREAQPLVQQQLAVLESGAFLWRGEAWRGQPLEWEVKRERGSGAEEPEPTHWQTRVKLALPQLGEVSATVGVTPRGVTVAIAAAEAAAATSLAGASGALATALNGAGLAVVGIEVKHVSA